MIGLKRAVRTALILVALTLTYFMLIVSVAYIFVDGIEFSVNGTGIDFNGLTYSDIKQFDIKSNSVFITTDKIEQADISECICDDNDRIRAITVIVTNPDFVCDFSIFGIHAGDSSAEVIDKMPKETKHIVNEDTGIRISKYVDKDNNVLIVGTDMELDVVSYVTVRIRE